MSPGPAASKENDHWKDLQVPFTNIFFNITPEHFQKYPRFLGKNKYFQIFISRNPFAFGARTTPSHFYVFSTELYTWPSRFGAISLYSAYGASGA